MLSGNRMASLVYKLVLIVVCFIGLLMNSGLTSGTFAPYVLLYYTIISNLFCLIFYIVSAVITGLNIKNTGKSGVIRFAPHFKGGVVMAMMLTMLIYFFVLADSPFVHASFMALFSNILVHFVVPVMVLVDWVLFDKKGTFKGSDPLVWLAVPFLYYLVVLFFAEPHIIYVEYYGGVHYPYRFIDPELIGWAPVLFHVFLLTAAYAAVGYILLGVDRLMGNHEKKKALDAAGALPAMQGIDDGADELDKLDDLVVKTESKPAAAATGTAVAGAAAAAAAKPAVTPAPAPQAAKPAVQQAPAAPAPQAPAQAVAPTRQATPAQPAAARPAAPAQASPAQQPAAAPPRPAATTAPTATTQPPAPPAAKPAATTPPQVTPPAGGQPPKN